MICIKIQHFNLNRILLLAIGLWPYQKSKFRLLQTTLCFSILTSFIIFQFTAFITTKCTIDFIIKTFCTVVFYVFCTINYSMFWINTHNVRNLLEQLQYIINELKDENELAIIKMCGNNTKLCTSISILFAICILFAGILILIWPEILHTVRHINESRIQNLAIHVTTEYFIDEEKYFYLNLLHINAVFCIMAITLTATGTMLLGYAIHACGLFKIASYRMKQVTSTEMLQNINLNNRTIIYNKILYAVEIHRKAMKFINLILTSFQGSFLLILAIIVITLSLNIFAMYRNALHGNKDTALLYIISISIITIYSFIINYVGELLLNHSNYVYSTIYNSRWYVAPLHVQKMILFILQRGNQSSHLNIAGLFVPSLENFAKITKASMSYFTVLYSTQQ
ncbi:uncharacterized protein LOC126855995 [Cataglyphis hispanica]|uniref:uncharacterized protein LOC126855995 n=1 Tax=Cataglyphis hispanica TaxID=1086592 RepID=UPI0021808F92|nr:uncharacterized protein LOC126855995 [Cataglyphis hispanica]